MKGRYTRHQPVVGEQGQQKLKDATVYISRVGGVGGTAANYLARTGVGKLLLAHGGNFDDEYLNRWQLAEESDVDRPCADVLRDALARVNSEIEVEILAENASDMEVLREFAGSADVVIDAAPMFEERYNNNLLAQELGVPMISGSMYAQEGYAMSFQAGKSGCLACLYPEKPDFWKNRHVFPALGTGPGIIGCLLADEAISYICHGRLNLLGQMMHYDLTEMDFHKLTLEKNPNCKVCSN